MIPYINKLISIKKYFCWEIKSVIELKCAYNKISDDNIKEVFEFSQNFYKILDRNATMGMDDSYLMDYNIYN